MAEYGLFHGVVFVVDGSTESPQGEKQLLQVLMLEQVRFFSVPPFWNLDNIKGHKDKIQTKNVRSATTHIKRQLINQNSYQKIET